MNYNASKQDRRNSNMQLYKALVFFIVFYVCSTFFYQLSPILNNIVGFVIVIITALIFLTDLRKNDLIILALVAYFIMASIFNGDNFDLFMTHAVHISSTILLLWKLASRESARILKQTIQEYKRPIWIVLVIVAAINACLLISGRFVSNNTGTVIFSGLSNGGHTIASISCLSAVIIMLLVNGNGKISKSLIMPILIYSLIVIASGSRIYLLVLLIAMIGLYMNKIKSLKHHRLYIVIAIIAIGASVYNSNMYERMVTTSENTYISSNQVEAFSSGRLIWWRYDMREYNNLGLDKKILGGGNSYVYEINSRYYGMKIWAHNDFIQILISYGVVGLILYALAIILFLKNISRQTDKKYVFMIAGSILLIACINGFYTQQHMVLFIILMLAFRSSDRASSAQEVRDIIDKKSKIV